MEREPRIASGTLIGITMIALAAFTLAVAITADVMGQAVALIIVFSGLAITAVVASSLLVLRWARKREIRKQREAIERSRER